MSNVRPSKSAEWLQLELETGGASGLLVLDCRSHELYESSHVETAINMAVTGLMLRRFRKGNIPVQTIIPKHEDKEKFLRRCKTDTVVLYDESGADWQDGGSSSLTTVLSLLLKKLRDDGCEAYYLEGNSFIHRFSMETKTLRLSVLVFGTFLSKQPICHFENI